MPGPQGRPPALAASRPAVGGQPQREGRAGSPPPLAAAAPAAAATPAPASLESDLSAALSLANIRWGAASSLRRRLPEKRGCDAIASTNSSPALSPVQRCYTAFFVSDTVQAVADPAGGYHHLQPHRAGAGGPSAEHSLGASSACREQLAARQAGARSPTSIGPPEVLRVCALSTLFGWGTVELMCPGVRAPLAVCAERRGLRARGRAGPGLPVRWAAALLPGICPARDGAGGQRGQGAV